MCAWPLKNSFVFFRLSSVLRFPELFPINNVPYLVKQGLIVPALWRSGKTEVINIWRGTYICVLIMITVILQLLIIEQIYLQAALSIFLYAVLQFIMWYVPIFLRHITQLVGQRQRDFYQSCFNIEIMFVLRFPTESNFSSPLSRLK